MTSYNDISFTYWDLFVMSYYSFNLILNHAWRPLMFVTILFPYSVLLVSVGDLVWVSRLGGLDLAWPDLDPESPLFSGPMNLTKADEEWVHSPTPEQTTTPQHHCQTKGRVGGETVAELVIWKHSNPILLYWSCRIAKWEQYALYYECLLPSGSMLIAIDLNKHINILEHKILCILQLN